MRGEEEETLKEAEGKSWRRRRWEVKRVLGPALAGGQGSMSEGDGAERKDKKEEEELEVSQLCGIETSRGKER